MFSNYTPTSPAQGSTSLPTFVLCCLFLEGGGPALDSFHVTKYPQKTCPARGLTRALPTEAGWKRGSLCPPHTDTTIDLKRLSCTPHPRAQGWPHLLTREQHSGTPSLQGHSLCGHTEQIPGMATLSSNLALSQVVSLPGCSPDAMSRCLGEGTESCAQEGDSEEQCASKQLEGWTSDVQATAMPVTQAWKYRERDIASAVH